MKKLIIAGALLILVIIIVKTCFFIVREDEQVVIVEFGKIAGAAVIEPGLHTKLPWQDARIFDKRWLEWDGDPNQITTRDKRYITIDVFARWRISDPIIFIEKLRDESSAQGRLDDIIDSATRNVVANYNLIESIRNTDRQFAKSDDVLLKEKNALLEAQAKLLDEKEVSAKLEEPTDNKNTAATGEEENNVDSDAGVQEEDTNDSENQAVADNKNNGAKKDLANDINRLNEPKIQKATKSQLDKNQYQIKFGRLALTQSILEKAKIEALKMGIELMDVKIKRIDYITTVQNSVFERMISERRKVAARLLSQGEGLSAEILGQKDRLLREIRSAAYREAEEIRGDADATAARIYAEAYNKDPELYAFLKTLESYRYTIDEDTWLLITTDTDYGKYFAKAQ